ncbi:P-type conjugative transfer protein TrbL [Sphingobium sp. LB126]|uniref:P-type conjugative transfer protein TrbL n=2 Tax=Sphingomonadaceae TaxID=41297 RepID=UPI000C20B702|nr:P-type conjugative transfer protein TrbL [Sphingobium sp. LB126]PJG45578.1 P-type conjugative transfer protein TrbL [Sphingobium sp. LB126]
MKALARLHLSALGVALTLAATPAYAQSQGMLDNVLNRYKGMAAAWASVFTTHASILFGALAAISLIWTFGQMALRRADLGEFASEAIRFAVFCGVFWWLLINGPAIGMAIIEGLRSLGAQASGLPDNLAPSGIVDIGFDIFRQAVESSSVLTPVDSALTILVSLGVLIVLALVGVNMLLLLASGYILAYGGVIFLGFGGSRWTSDIALNYFKTVVAVGASLMTMVLIVGVGKTFLDQYYAATGEGSTLQDLGTMLVFAVVLLALVNKVPAMVGGVISGGSIHAAGGIGAFGAGAALGAAGMAAGAAATGGAMIAAGAMNAAGGASAIKAAFAAAGGGGGEGGQTGMGGGQPLSSAGDMPGGGDNGGGGGGGGGTPLSMAMGGDGGSPPANDNSRLQGGSEAASAGGGTAASAAAGSEAADREDSNGGGAAGGSPAGEGEASSASSQGEGTPASGDTGGTQRTGLSRAAKTASILGGAAAGMAVDALKERVGNTVGGRLAANIRASAASASSGSETLAPATGAGSPASSSDSSPPPTAQFAGDTISAARDAGDMETPEDEVAAFVQRRGDS